jgi:hypothetical protein
MVHERSPYGDTSAPEWLHFSSEAGQPDVARHAATCDTIFDADVASGSSTTSHRSIPESTLTRAGGGEFRRLKRRCRRGVRRRDEADQKRLGHPLAGDRLPRRTGHYRRGRNRRPQGLRDGARGARPWLSLVRVLHGRLSGWGARTQEPLLLPLARAEFAAARYALGTGDDAVLDMWLSYRLNAVRHELLPPGALSSRDRVLAPGFVLAPERLASS